MNELEKINETIFESIKHVDEDGNEYWYARTVSNLTDGYCGRTFWSAWYAMQFFYVPAESQIL